MNCKPGDLAILVRSVANNEGRVVQCLRLATPEELKAAWFVSDKGPVWRIDLRLRMGNGKVAALARDACLRPIRPGDITDEEVRDLYAPKLPEAA